MSFDIQGVGPIQGPNRVNAVRPTSQTTSVAATQATEDSVEIRTMPSSPPPEVLAAIGTASDAYDRLRASGRQLQFASDPSSGRLSIQLQDLGGNPISQLTPSKVLSIADGENL